MVRNKRRLKVKTVRLTAVQAKTIERWSAEDGVDFSTFVRTALEREGHRRLKLPLPVALPNIWERLAEAA